MLPKFLFATLVFGLLGAVFAQDDPPDTVDELNIELYVGRWYQVINICNLQLILKV